MAKLYRPAIPDRVKLIAVLRELGLTLGDVNFDHCPPLGLREYDEKTRTYTPSANDPDKIVMRTTQAHRDKTNHPRGPHTTVGSDRHLIDKTRNGRDTKFAVVKPPLPARMYDWAHCDGCGLTVVNCTCQPASLDRPATIDPGPKCRGCGEYGPDCTCPPREKRSAFQRAR